MLAWYCSARKIFRRISWLIPSLTAEMVRYVEIDYIFKHPFEAVSRAYFQKVSFFDIGSTVIFRLSNLLYSISILS